MAEGQLTRQRQLDVLITTIAKELMGVPLAKAKPVMEHTLQEVVDFFEVENGLSEGTIMTRA